jgi:hypothetical protein
MAARQSVRQQAYDDLARGATLQVSATFTPAAPTDTPMGATMQETTGNFNVPAGCKYVRIYNAGGDAPATGTVNGQPWTVGRVEEYRLIATADKNYTLPAYAIVGNGSLFEISYLT